MSTVKMVRKKFETKEELLKFISTNTLAKANVSMGEKSVEYEVGENKDETPGCVGCNAGENTPPVFDIAKLLNKGEVIDAIKKKAEEREFELGEATLEIIEDNATSRADLNEYFNDDANFVAPE